MVRVVRARSGDRAGGSLDGDGGAGALEGGLGLLRSVLGDLLQDRLGRVVDQVLGLLEAEGGQAGPPLVDLVFFFTGSLGEDAEPVLSAAPPSGPPPPPP